MHVSQALSLAGVLFASPCGDCVTSQSEALCRGANVKGKRNETDRERCCGAVRASLPGSDARVRHPVPVTRCCHHEGRRTLHAKPDPSDNSGPGSGESVGRAGRCDQPPTIMLSISLLITRPAPAPCRNGIRRSDPTSVGFAASAQTCQAA